MLLRFQYFHLIGLSFKRHLKQNRSESHLCSWPPTLAEIRRQFCCNCLFVCGAVWPQQSVWCEPEVCRAAGRPRRCSAPPRCLTRVGCKPSSWEVCSVLTSRFRLPDCVVKCISMLLLPVWNWAFPIPISFRFLHVSRSVPSPFSSGTFFSLVLLQLLFVLLRIYTAPINFGVGCL